MVHTYLHPLALPLEWILNFPRKIFSGQKANGVCSVLFVVFLLCMFALCLCFLFVICVFALYFFVFLFCASFLCLYLIFTLCFFLVSVHCICIQHSYWRSCLFMFCDCDLCGVFVHSVRSFCLCMFVLCACLCFVLAICICFVFVICALWLFLLCIYTLCMSFVFLPCVCACTVSFAVARFVALAGSFGA